MHEHPFPRNLSWEGFSGRVCVSQGWGLGGLGCRLVAWGGTGLCAPTHHEMAVLGVWLGLPPTALCWCSGCALLREVSFCLLATTHSSEPWGGSGAWDGRVCFALISASGRFSGLCCSPFVTKMASNKEAASWFCWGSLRFGAAEEGVGMSEVAGQEVKQKWKSNYQNKDMGSYFLSSQCWVQRNPRDLGALSVKVNTEQGWSRLLSCSWAHRGWAVTGCARHWSWWAIQV